MWEITKYGQWAYIEHSLCSRRCGNLCGKLLLSFSHSVVSDSLWHHGWRHPGFRVLHHLPELAQAHDHWVTNAINHLILCCPILLLSSILTSFRVFSNESALHIGWPKYWSFGFSFSPSNEYSGLISFRIDWFNLLAVQGTLKSLLQHHSSKASILRCSAFFIVQLSHPYLTTGKIITLSIRTFVRKLMSLIFNMFSNFVIAFLPRSKHLFYFMATVTICSDFGAP